MSSSTRSTPTPFDPIAKPPPAQNIASVPDGSPYYIRARCSLPNTPRAGRPVDVELAS
jgi:hypothetical protein